MREDLDVLLVDDTQADIKLALHVMKEQNASHRLHLIRDGEDALDFILRLGENEGAHKCAFRLILLDLKLPKVNGFEVLKGLPEQPHFRTCPVVVLSSSNQDRDVLRSYELGANGYVQKPVSFDDFRDVIRRIAEYWLGANLVPERRLFGARADISVVA